MKMSDYLSRVGVPQKFMSADVNNVSWVDDLKKADMIDGKDASRYRDVYERGKKIVDDFKAGLFIQGRPGSGKTFFGVALMRETVRNGMSAVRATPMEVIEKYFDQWEIRKRYAAADFLFLDDFDKNISPGMKTNASVIEGLIKHRLDRGRVTAYASASCPDDLEGLFSAGVVEMIKNTAIKISMPDVNLVRAYLDAYGRSFLSNDSG